MTRDKYDYQDMTKERLLFIDWLRVVAALFVVMIHTSGMLYLDSPKGMIEYYLGFWNMEIVRTAVPLFFMISGALLLRQGYDATPRKMVKKALKVLALMLIWSFIYALVYVHPLTIKALVFKTIKGPFHFWFLEYLIGLYLLTPIFNVIANYQNGILERYYLWLFFVFGICIESFQAIPFCHKWIMDVTTKVSVPWLGFAGFFFLGHYLTTRQFNVSPWLLLLLFFGAVLLQGWFTAHVPLLHSSDKFWWLTIIEATTLFVLFVNARWIRNEQYGWIKALSSLMLGVYILHPLISENIPEKFWTASLYGINVIVVFGGSLLASFFLMKIPVIGKWLLSI